MIARLALAIGMALALGAWLAGGPGSGTAPVVSTCAAGTLNFAQACNSGFTPIM